MQAERLSGDYCKHAENNHKRLSSPNGCGCGGNKIYLSGSCVGKSKDWGVE